GEEAVAGVDGVDVVLLGEGDDAGDVEVGADGFAGLADAVRFVGLEAVQGEAVLVGVEGDGADAELVGGAENTDGDLAAVGDEELADAARRRNGSFLRHGNPSRDPRRERGRLAGILWTVGGATKSRRAVSTPRPLISCRAVHRRPSIRGSGAS